MDQTQDLSARVLLNHILTTDIPRTPITRSTSLAAAAGTSGTRRSSRFVKKDGQTPKDMLRRSLKHKMRESISRKSPLPAKRSITMTKKTPMPTQASQLFDDEETPRHLLRNILQTEPVRSPVVHKKAATEEPQLPSANSSITSKRSSIELSGMELPDLTIGIAASTMKGLGRKRPRRSLNVTAFEKRFREGDDVEDNESIGGHSSLSSSSLSYSSTTLSLKTPFVDVRTEKRGLQRKVYDRRKISEEEFDAAVDKRHLEGMGGVMLEEPVLGEATVSEGFTLGLTKLGEPDITSDIINCNTALYAQTDVVPSNFSIIATQDKPTVMASQLHREMEQLEEEQEHKEESVYLFPTEEGDPQGEDCVSQSENEEEGAADSHTEKDVAARSQTEEEDAEESESEQQDPAGTSQTEEEDAEEDLEARSQTEEEDAEESESEQQDPAGNSQSEEEADSQVEGDLEARSQTDEDKDAEESETEQQDAAGSSQSEEEDAEEDLEARSQTEEEDAEEDESEQQDPAGNSQSEEEADCQVEEDLEARSQTDEDEDAKESETEQQDPAGGSQSEEEADSQTENEPDGKPVDEHISRRSRRSEGGLLIVREAEKDLPDSTDAGCSEVKSHSDSSELQSGMAVSISNSSRPHVGIPESAESSAPALDQSDISDTEEKPDADKENSFHFPEMTHYTEDGEQPSGVSPEEAAAPGQEEEWQDEEEEEGEDVPMRTPAFVKQKRNFFLSDPTASPVLKIIQTSDAGLNQDKTKPVRQRKTRTAKKETALPKSYLMNVFKHFAKTKVSPDVYPVLEETMDKFFTRLASDLETYALHAGRKTIEVEDAVLLLRRQGYVNDKVPVEVLIEKYLRMDQRKLLIPIATSGNVVVPQKRR